MTEPRDTVIEEILQAKFDPAELKLNQDGLTYVEDETVMDRLDFALGFGSWGTFTQAIDNRSVIVGLKVRDPRTGQWSEFADYGYCTNPGTHEALKEAWTDGFRRVARQAGVARYVYAGEAEAPTTQGQPSQWVAAPPPAQAVTTAPAATQQPVAVPQQVPVPQGADGGLCPIHGWTWTIQKGGVSRSTNKPYPPFYKCGGKVNGGYCPEKPTDEWIAAHPIA